MPFGESRAKRTQSTAKCFELFALTYALRSHPSHRVSVPDGSLPISSSLSSSRVNPNDRLGGRVARVEMSQHCQFSVSGNTRHAYSRHRITGNPGPFHCSDSPNCEQIRVTDKAISGYLRGGG